jgi:hypothetical protein
MMPVHTHPGAGTELKLNAILTVKNTQHETPAA